MGANNHKSASLIVAILIAVVIFKYSHSDSPEGKLKADAKSNGTPIPGGRATAADPQVQPLEDFLMKWDPKEDFTVDVGPDRSPIIINSGHFLITKIAEPKFIAGWAAVNQIPLAQISKISSEKKTTNFSEVSAYQQRFKSYDVENSEIKIFRRTSGERVYYISATMKPILELDETIRVTKDQALQTLKNSVAPERQLKIIKTSDKPIVLNETTPQLCWKFTVTLENPTEERRVYIGVASGATVHSSYTLEH